MDTHKHKHKHTHTQVHTHTHTHIFVLIATTLGWELGWVAHVTIGISLMMVI